MNVDQETIVWRTSRHSAGTNCVEVAVTCAAVRTRDSKDPNGPELAFTVDAWRRFLRLATSGALDG